MNMNATPTESPSPESADIRFEQYRDEYVTDTEYAEMLAAALDWGK